MVPADANVSKAQVTHESERKGWFVDLSDYEVAGASKQPAASMATVFAGPFPQGLRARVAEIVSANPWLAGRLHTNPSSGKPAIWMCSCNDSSAYLEVVPVEDDDAVLSFSQSFSVGRGWQLLGTDEPICRIVALVASSGQRWSLQISMCHMIADAYTLYAIYRMLDSSQRVWPMQVERAPCFDPSASLQAASFQGEWPPFRRPAGILRIRYVREDWIKEQQARFAAEVDAPFVSSHDLLTSWFHQTTKPACGILGFNMRNRSLGVHDSMAGCYVALAALCPEEYKSPANIRRAVTRMSAACTPDGKPQSCGDGGLGAVTAWHSFYHDLNFDGCKQLMHSPVMNYGAVPFACIFRPQAGKLAMVTWTEEELQPGLLGPLGEAVWGTDPYIQAHPRGAPACISSPPLDLSNLAPHQGNVDDPVKPVKENAKLIPGPRPTGGRLATWATWGVATVSFLVLALAMMAIFFVVLALAWKAGINTGMYVASLVFLLLLVFVPCSLSCLGSCGRFGLEAKMWRVVFQSSPLFGVFGFACFFAVMFNLPETKVLNASFDPTRPVLVVGSGPSGLSAAWMLAKSGRQVQLLEATDDFGGHSKTWVEHTDAGEQRLDIGFIFNNQEYYRYMNFSTYFDYPLKDTAINVSGAFNGRYWDNVHRRGIFGKDLEEEADRFLKMVHEPESILRLLTPLWLFLWWHGFSDDFYQLGLKSILSTLFVTKMGLYKQSAQATLNYFKPNAQGFSHMRYEKARIQHNPKGSQFMWRDIIADANSTGLLDIQFNSRVQDLVRETDGWRAILSDGRTSANFQDIILAIPADESARLVHNPIQKFLLYQIQYQTSYLSLHTDAEATVAKAEFAPAHNSSVLYFVEPSMMTGKIASIFGDPSSNLLLTVHDHPDALNPAMIKKQYEWSHHYFSLWELAIALRILPLLNGIGGIHLAGDWARGMGHNDAMLAGIAAACAAGLAPHLAETDPARRLYANLLRDVCYEAPLLTELATSPRTEM